ncbi:MAG: hypothetical protein OXH99_04630 [Bryobacterales bacterium]|nr:hypothetical protein [Bryobacterales bacterium]
MERLGWWEPDPVLRDREALEAGGGAGPGEEVEVEQVDGLEPHPIAETRVRRVGNAEAAVSRLLRTPHGVQETGLRMAGGVRTGSPVHPAP